MPPITPGAIAGRGLPPLDDVVEQQQVGALAVPLIDDLAGERDPGRVLVVRDGLLKKPFRPGIASRDRGEAGLKALIAPAARS